MGREAYDTDLDDQAEMDAQQADEIDRGYDTIRDRQDEEAYEKGQLKTLNIETFIYIKCF